MLGHAFVVDVCFYVGLVGMTVIRFESKVLLLSTTPPLVLHSCKAHFVGSPLKELEERKKEKKKNKRKKEKTSLTSYEGRLPYLDIRADQTVRTTIE